MYGSGSTYYFKVHSEDTARAFWMSASVGWRAEMKLVFKDFPEMKDVVEEFDSKDSSFGTKYPFAGQSFSTFILA